MKENKIINARNIFSLLLIVFIIIVFIFVYIPQKQAKEDILINESISKKIVEPDLSGIIAKSYIVYDILDNKIFFSKDENRTLPLASITKLMTGFVALNILPDTTVVIIGQDNIAKDGDSGLVVEEKWQLKKLLDFSLITSSNDGMSAIASTINEYEAVNQKNTIEIMNEQANILGLKNTVFLNETGLDVDSGTGGAYSSSYDIAKFLGIILRKNPSLISETNKKSKIFVSESGIKHSALNTNIITNKIPFLIASKTGFTDLAGGNLAVVVDAGFMHPIAIVVLGSTTDGRFEDVSILTKAALEKISE